MSACNNRPAKVVTVWPDGGRGRGGGGVNPTVTGVPCSRISKRIRPNRQTDSTSLHFQFCSNWILIVVTTHHKTHLCPIRYDVYLVLITILYTVVSEKVVIVNSRYWNRKELMGFKQHI